MNTVYTHPLPHLSPEDHALLLRYFSLNEDLQKLAAQLEGQPGHPDLLTLLHWLSRPEIAAYIAAYRTHQNQLHRQAVIDALRSILSSSADQVELRRAAASLLRTLSLGTPTLRGGTSAMGGSMHAGTPTPRGGPPATSGTHRAPHRPPIGSLTSSATHPPHTRTAPTHHARPAAPPAPQPIPPVSPSSLDTSTSPSPTPNPPSATSPAAMSLEAALAALGLPTNLDELDRLDDEADDADLDAWCDGENLPQSNNSS